MTITENKAQGLCSATEWKTVVKSFPPKLSELGASGAKKSANRIARFLEKAESEGAQDRVRVMREALDRLRDLVPDKSGSDKQSARRRKEKNARKESREQKSHRAQLKESLRQSGQKKNKKSVAESKSENRPKKKSIREQFLGERK